MNKICAYANSKVGSGHFNGQEWVTFCRRESSTAICLLTRSLSGRERQLCDQQCTIMSHISSEMYVAYMLLGSAQMAGGGVEWGGTGDAKGRSGRIPDVMSTITAKTFRRLENGTSPVRS